jgi:predicted TIM-barrel fold metal-dependent hydrolase
MIIDAHTHLYNDEGYLEGLVAEYQRLGIAKGCLSGLGPLFDLAGNDAVEAAIRRYPNIIIGFGYVRLGQDGPELVEELYQRGFRGLKFTCPLANYDDRAYSPIYARAEALGMPALFHCGIVNPARKGREWDVSSARMRPVYLDTVARAFPGLNLICAHMGVPWFEEATTIARLVSNVYLDITGAPRGWRAMKSAAFFQELLCWDGAWNKIIWGTDVHYRDMGATLNRDLALAGELGLSEKQRDNLFGGTIARLLPK